jgi:hypothetical protein
MTIAVLLPALTAVLAVAFALALLDQWRERRRSFQLVWAIGMIFFAIASATEALGALGGWSEPLYRTWYFTGAVATAGWLGLGSALLLSRTRFGYAYGVLVILGGIAAFFIARRYPDAGSVPLLVLIGALVLGLAVIIETYFQNERWPLIAAIGVVTVTVATVVFVFAGPLTGALPGQAEIPTGVSMPGTARTLSFVMNIPGGLSLVLGALFSAYIFMPKRRVLDYSLDPGQPAEHVVFNAILAVVAIPVNFVASLPVALKALVTGRIHSRVPATLLIGIGGFVASSVDLLSRLGSPDLFQIGKFVSVVLIFLGFLVSIEIFREIRIPFTGRVLRSDRHERVAVATSESTN